MQSGLDQGLEPCSEGAVSMSDTWNEVDADTLADPAEGELGEVSEPDLLEQRRPVDREAIATRHRRDGSDPDIEVPDADAWEQQMPVGQDDEY